MVKQSRSEGTRKVLFVCTGNICRSPTAEGVFRALVAREGLAQRIVTASAGTHGYHIGDPPDPRAIAHARRRGYDLSSLRAKRLEGRDFERYDLLLACDAGHHAFLSRLAPSDRRGRVALLMALHAPAHGKTGNPFDLLHLFHRPVAALAFQPGRDVPLVGKVNMVR